MDWEAAKEVSRLYSEEQKARQKHQQDLARTGFTMRQQLLKIMDHHLTTKEEESQAQEYYHELSGSDYRHIREAERFIMEHKR